MMKSTDLSDLNDSFQLVRLNFTRVHGDLLIAVTCEDSWALFMPERFVQMN
jgi:hypothetical protein